MQRKHSFRIKVSKKQAAPEQKGSTERSRPRIISQRFCMFQKSTESHSDLSGAPQLKFGVSQEPEIVQPYTQRTRNTSGRIYNNMSCKKLKKMEEKIMQSIFTAKQKIRPFQKRKYPNNLDAFEETLLKQQKALTIVDSIKVLEDQPTRTISKRKQALQKVKVRKDQIIKQPHKEPTQKITNKENHNPIHFEDISRIEEVRDENFLTTESFQGFLL